MASTPVITEQRFSIYPTYIVSTPIWSGGNGRRTSAQRESEKHLKDNSHKGQLSHKASSRLRNAVNWLVSSAGYKRVYSKVDQKHYYFKVNFITLTFPQQEGRDISGKELHKTLHAWLVYARKYFYLRNYVWKVERGAQGKIHVHMTTDTFIHYRRLRDSWNRLLIKEGYVDAYYARTGHFDPNSTDVHSVRSIKNLGGYLCKYMDKSSGLDESYTNRIWGCSSMLSDSNKCRYLADAHETSEVASSLMNPDIKWKHINSKPDAFGRVRSVGEIYFVNTDDWSRLIRGKIRSTYDEHRYYIRKSELKPPEDYLTLNDTPISVYNIAAGLKRAALLRQAKKGIELNMISGDITSTSVTITLGKTGTAAREDFTYTQGFFELN